MRLQHRAKTKQGTSYLHQKQCLCVGRKARLGWGTGTRSKVKVKEPTRQHANDVAANKELKDSAHALRLKSGSWSSYSTEGALPERECVRAFDTSQDSWRMAA